MEFHARPRFLKSDRQSNQKDMSQQFYCRIHPGAKSQRSQGYWSGGTALCVECYPNGIRATPEDILEQQKIDADCNDCRHFKRGQMTKVGGLTKFDGYCLKFDRPTTAWPMQFTGRECFEHRRG